MLAQEITKLPDQYQGIVNLISASSERKGDYTGGYLLFGPQGTAKSIIAKEVASKLLGVSHTAVEQHPDLMILRCNEITTSSAETTKNFISNFSSTPLVASKKIGIIEFAEELSIQAQNSLLKTLEEPPTDSLLLVLSDNQHQLLATIRSRLTKIYLPMLPKKVYASSINKKVFSSLPEALAPYCEGRLERTIQLQNPESQKIALEAERMYSDICAHPENIFTYTGKKKTEQEHPISEYIPFIIYFAEQDLKRNTHIPFANRLIQKLISLKKSKISNNISLVLENVCLQEQ